MPVVTGRWTALVVAAAVVLPAVSQARTVLHGETSLGARVNLTLGDAGRPEKLTFAWRAPCRGGSTLRDASVMRPPTSASTATRFRAAGSYLIRQRRGGYRIRVSLDVRGRRVDTAAWVGTIQMTALVRRRGRLVNRCRLRDMEWSAGSSSPPAPAPGVAPPPAAPPPTRPSQPCCPNESPMAGAWGLTTHSDPGDPVGFESLPDHTYGPPNDHIVINASRDSVGFSVYGNDGTGFHGRFWAPSGQQLAVREYQNAQKIRTPDRPAMGIFGSNGRDCSQIAGSFNVTELVWDATGTIQTFKVTFEQHCDGSVPALHGTLEFHAAAS
jgi:hypothetical protein